MDRIIGLLILLVVAAAVLPLLVAPAVTIALVLTFCFVVIAVTRYLTDRW
jgi:hypothetical protein